jgi:hypothetical protein
MMIGNSKQKIFRANANHAVKLNNRIVWPTSHHLSHLKKGNAIISATQINARDHPAIAAKE